MSSEDKEAQEDELLALASIYDEDEFKRAQSVQGGETRISVELPENFTLFLSGNWAENPPNNVECIVHFLPPIVLNFEFPADYPSTSPPAFTLSSKWLSQAQVKELVEEQLFARYDRLLLQSSLDLMSDVVYCPRPCCQTPVMQDPCCSMGICSSCSHAFCTVCKMAYHGIATCKMSAEYRILGPSSAANECITEKLLEVRDQYITADQATKRFLEKHYGKRIIQKAVEELKSNQWVEGNSRSCPSCGAPIQKIDGCQRMTCAACNKNFCWRCMNIITTPNPYMHFHDPASPCFGKL